MAVDGDYLAMQMRILTAVIEAAFHSARDCEETRQLLELVIDDLLPAMEKMTREVERQMHTNTAARYH